MNKCIKNYAKYQRENRKKNPEKYREYDRRKYEKHKDEIIKSRKKYYTKNREKILQYGKKYHLRNRSKIYRQEKDFRDSCKKFCIAHYSNGTLACAHCSENRLSTLHIDHVNGGGTKERLVTGITGYT